MIFDHLTPPQGKQFHPRLKLLRISCSTRHKVSEYDQEIQHSHNADPRKDTQ